MLRGMRSHKKILSGFMWWNHPLLLSFACYPLQNLSRKSLEGSALSLRARCKCWRELISQDEVCHNKQPPDPRSTKPQVHFLLVLHVHCGLAGALACLVAIPEAMLKEQHHPGFACCWSRGRQSLCRSQVMHVASVHDSLARAVPHMVVPNFKGVWVGMYNPTVCL